jgi:hypothetical protein
MNSRDRLRGGVLHKEVERELEDLLKNQPGLRALRERRRREEIESRIEDSKPLEQILESLLKHSPTLANLFQFGNRASNQVCAALVGGGADQDTPGAYAPGSSRPATLSLNSLERSSPASTSPSTTGAHLG